jgi:hypothetical protein
MKAFKINSIFLTIALLSSLSCSKESSDSDSDDKAPGQASSKMVGTWERNDGQAKAYIKLEGSVATTCTDNTITVGTYDPSVPSATFIVGGVKYIFPLSMQGETLIVKVPSQGNANHVPTEYIKSTKWPCGGGGTGGTTTTPAPKTGMFRVKVYYEGTGSCKAATFDQTLKFTTYCGDGKHYTSTWGGIWVTGQDAGGKYRVCLFGGESEKKALCAANYNLYNRFYKLEWTLFPTKSGLPSSCTTGGVVSIDTQDQVKDVILKN